MAKHKPSVIWPTRRIGVYPQFYLATVDSKNIKLAYCSANMGGVVFHIDRRHARLLAKRINQMLDETK